MKPALAAVRRRESLGQLSTLSAAIAPNHADLLDWDRSLRWATAIINLSASRVKEPVPPLIHGRQAQRGSPPSMRERARIGPL